jgi:hypothetical protein
MRFTEGDTVRHRGLNFISGIVVQVIRVPDGDLENDRSYFCKVRLKNGQYYSDRTTEWEPSLESLDSSTAGAKVDREQQLYAKMG